MVLIAFAVTIIVLIYAYYKWATSYWKRVGVPHLEPKFPFGNIGGPIGRKTAIAFELKHIYEELKGKGAKAGGFYIATSPLIMPIDAEVVRAVLNKNFQSFTDRGIYHNTSAEPLEGHLFFIGGKKWRNLRVKLTPTFTSGKMKMMFNILLECAGPFLKAMEKHADEGKPVDIKDMLACFTTDIIGSCAFGLECNSFKEEEAEFRKQGRKVFKPSLKRQLKVQLVNISQSLSKLLGVSLLDKEVSNFFQKVVAETVDYRERTHFERNDFMQLLINVKNESENGSKLTLNDLAAQAFVFFIAGYETSSTAMTFCLFELAVNPEIQEKLRKDINRVLAQHDGKFTYESVQDMKYLGQVLDEALRKYPPVPALHRKCTEDCYLEEAGITVEKGIRALIPVLGLHYDPDYFPDPEKFDPDRFSEENKGNILPYTYLPFGEGPRNCIGSRFGLMQSKVGLALLVKNFEISLSEKMTLPLRMNPFSFILTTQGEMWLTVKKIQE